MVTYCICAGPGPLAREWCSFFLEIELSCENGAVFQYKLQPHPALAKHRQQAQEEEEEEEANRGSCTQYIKDTNL